MSLVRPFPLAKDHFEGGANCTEGKYDLGKLLNGLAWASSSSMIHVDSTAEANEQDGSSSRPFTTLKAAVAEARVRANQVQFFLISPSFEYASEDTIVIPPGRIWIFESSLRACSLPGISWAPTGDFAADPLTGSILFLRNVQIIGSIWIDARNATDARFGSENCGFSDSFDAIHAAGLTLAISGLSNASFTLIDSKVIASQLSGEVDLEEATLLVANTRFDNTLRCGGLYARDCSFSDDVLIVGNESEIINCVWRATAVFNFESPDGVLNIDEPSYNSYLAKHCSTANGTLRSAGPLIGELIDITWDGVAPIELEILPSNHPAGLYEFKIVTIIVVPRQGYIIFTQKWHDLTGSNALDSDNALTNFLGAVRVSLNAPLLYSDGTEALALRAQAQGDPGPVSIKLYVSASRV